MVILPKLSILLVAVLAIIFFVTSYDRYYFPATEHLHYLFINTTTSSYVTDEKFLSLGLDTSFMNVSFHKFNQSDWLQLIKYTSALAPAYLRLGGTAADQVFFKFTGNGRGAREITEKDSDSFIVSLSPTHYLNISGDDWLIFYNFVNNSNLKLLLDLNVLLRNGSDWDSRNAEELISFAGSRDMEIDFQLGNEPNSFKHVFNVSISGKQLAQDFARLHQIISKSDKYKYSKLVGPDVTRPKLIETSSLSYLKDFLKNSRHLNAITWHQYYLNGRTAQLEDFTDPSVLDSFETQIKAVTKVGHQFLPDVPIWLSETGSAYGGGAPNLSDSFAASFLWLDKLGMAAKMGLNIVVRQSLFQGHYGLLDKDLKPLPDYWISLVYKLFVGKTVLNVTVAKCGVDNRLRFYSHCLKNNDFVMGNVILFGMNLWNRTEYLSPAGLGTYFPIIELIFSAPHDDLTSKTVLVNGHPLIERNGEVDVKQFVNNSLQMLPLRVPPLSIGFWIFPGRRDPACLQENSS